MFPEKQPQTILDFWFGTPDSQDYGKQKKFWFIKNSKIDEEIKNKFLSYYQDAINGKLNHWQETPLGCLALIIIFDQFPRNIFRNTHQAFATDFQALALAKYALNNKFDRELPPVFRWFIYLPLEHSENLEDQNLSVELFSKLKDDPDSKSTIEYAIVHRQIIEIFGRFPHRNCILGRKNTREEETFLQQPGSSF